MIEKGYHHLVGKYLAPPQALQRASLVRITVLASLSGMTFLVTYQTWFHWPKNQTGPSLKTPDLPFQSCKVGVQEVAPLALLRFQATPWFGISGQSQMQGDKNVLLRPASQWLPRNTSLCCAARPQCSGSL